MSRTERLIILGIGGNVLDVLDVVDAINRVEPTWRVAGFLDDGATPASMHLGWPVLGTLGDASSHLGCSFVSAIWNDRIFRTLHHVLARTGLAVDRFATLVHPGAAVSSRAVIGRNVVVQHGATIAGDVSIADHVWVGPRCTVGHGCDVGSFSILAPGALLGGRVHVERNCYVGSGALVRPSVRLSELALVGMGAVVLNDVPSGVTVVGNPAAPLIRH